MAATRTAIALALGAGAATIACGQPYPAKPVRIVVTLAPSGAVDGTARALAQKLGELWPHPVVVENRPGAGGTIATEIVAKSPADGHTLLVANTGHAMTPAMYKLSYDVVKDFAPVTVLVIAPNVLSVHPSLPVRSMPELVALARRRPGELLFSSPGNGSPPHLVVELLNQAANVQIVHVAYKGTAPSVTDLIAGRVSATSASVVSTMPHVETGRLRALAVVGARRAQAAPQLPTIVESGVPGVEVDNWYALLAPAATPRDIVLKLNAEVVRILAQPDMRAKLAAMGLEPVGNAPDEVAAYLRNEVAKWTQLIRSRGIRIQ